MPALLYLTVFLMGLHSTVFGPVKYSYLPQHLDTHEITGGNGLVEMGTFVAILVGTIGGGLLINQFGPNGAAATAAVVLVIAVLGRAAAQFVPLSPAADPDLRINWNPFTETAANLRIARTSPAVFNSILGISWLWFFGSIFLTSFTPFARENLGGDEGVVTFLLAVFSFGIGTGSLVTERLSGRKVEIGLVPLGSIGMTVFAVDLYLASRGFATMQGGTLVEFLRHDGAWRIVFDLAALSFFGGLYSVPLYALIQSRAEKTHVARIVAANNILNALFMVTASLMAAALLVRGPDDPAALPRHRHPERRRGGLHLSPRAGVPAALHRVGPGPHAVPGAVDRDGPHPGPGRGRAGLQPRQLRRRDRHHGREPAADPLRDGPPDLQDPADELVLPERQGDRDRAGQGGSDDAGEGQRAHRRGARRRRPRLHLSRRGGSPTPARCTRSSRASRGSSNAIPCP